MSEENIVFVSEHQAPSNWDCIWEQETQRSINHSRNISATEKLFRIKNSTSENTDK